MPPATSVKKNPEFDPRTYRPERNYFRMSARLMTDLYPKRLSGHIQQALIEWIAMETWGVKSECVYASLTIAELCVKFECSRQALDDAIDDAVKRRLIAKEGKRGGKMRYRLTPQNWADAPLYTPPPAKAAPAATPRPILASSGMVLFPGKSSTPVPLQVTTSDGQSVEVRVEYTNGSTRPLSFTVSAGPDGILRLSIGAGTQTVAQPGREGERKANDLPSLPGIFSPQPVENKQNRIQNVERAEEPENNAPAVAQPKGVKRGEQPGREGEIKANDLPSLPGIFSPQPVENKQNRIQNVERAEEPKNNAPAVAQPKGVNLAEYREFLVPLMLHEWKRALDGAFLRRIVQTARQAPVEYFRRACERKFGRKNERASSYDHGILLSLASDAAQDYQAVQDQPRPRPAPRMTEAQYAELLDTLPAEERDYLLEKLRREARQA